MSTNNVFIDFPCVVSVPTNLLRAGVFHGTSLASATNVGEFALTKDSTDTGAHRAQFFGAGNVAIGGDGHLYVEARIVASQDHTAFLAGTVQYAREVLGYVINSASARVLLDQFVDTAVSSRSTYAGGPVASVAGNVGGNVVGSVASVTAAVTANVTHSGTAQAGASTSITLASGASSVDNYYVGQMVILTGGTGAAQVRTITAYVGSTKVTTVDSAWATNPSSSSTYILVGGTNSSSSGGGATAAQVWAYGTRTLSSNPTLGTGAYAITVHVTDGTSALGNATVRMSSTVWGTTDGSGNVVFGLDAGTYTLAATKAGYTYTPTTQTVSAIATINVVMSTSSALSPTSSQCLAEMYTYDANDELAAAVVIEYEFVSLGTAGRSYPRNVQQVTSDAGGHVQVLLRRGATYRFRRDTGEWVEGVLVPGSGGLTLPEVLGRPG